MNNENNDSTSNALNTAPTSMTTNNTNYNNENWRLWCRLCANDKIEGICVNEEEQQQKHNTTTTRGTNSCSDLSLSDLIKKYFGVHIELNDGLPQMICNVCFSSINLLRKFAEDAARAQNMYVDLQNCFLQGKNLDPYKIRLKCGLFQKSRDQIVAPFEDVVKDHFDGATEHTNPSKECIGKIYTDHDSDYEDYDECDSDCKKENLSDDDELVKIAAKKTINLYTCHYCNRKFLTNLILREHTKRVHMKDGQFVCGKCGINLSTKGALSKHMFTHPKCYICKKTFMSTFCLKSHMETHGN